MKSKIILLFAILVFAGLTILLSMAIEKTKTPPPDSIENNEDKEIKKKSSKKKTSELNDLNKNEKTSSGALESMQWMTQIRAYPDTDIPADKFFKAFEFSKNNLQDINTKDGLDEWRSLGPNNIGGEKSLSCRASRRYRYCLYGIFIRRIMEICNRRKWC